MVKISRKINSVKGWLRWNNGDIFFERPHWNGLWNGGGVGGGETKSMQASRTTLLFSRFFLSFRFLSLPSRIRQSLLLPMRTTPTSKAVLSTVMFITVDVRVFFIAVGWIVPDIGSIREISDGLRKALILLCVAFGSLTLTKLGYKI